MKKFYTLIAAAFLALGVNAQTDLSISWLALTEGETVEDAEFEAGVILTNEGPTIPIGDTIVISYRIDGEYISFSFDAAYSYYEVVDEDFETGAELSFSNGVIVSESLESEFCAVVHGIGEASYTTFLGDSNPDDNVTCVSVDVEIIDDSGVEDLELALGDVYIAGGQLMIVNEGVTTEELANLKIININGQTVQSENLVLAQGTSTVNINSLAAGIYIVAVEVDGGVVTRKISIQ